MRTTFEGPAILPGYAYRLRLVSEHALFPEVARFVAQIRVGPSSDNVLAEISSAAGGFERISDTELDLEVVLDGNDQTISDLLNSASDLGKVGRLQ